MFFYFEWPALGQDSVVQTTIRPAARRCQSRPVRFAVTGETTEVPDRGPLAGTGLEGPLPRGAP